jgi:RNA polymerase sigma factor for flagellar operon FliA
MPNQAISLITSRDCLINDYYEYVYAIAKKLIKHMNLPSSMYEEFVAAGMLGLVEAASRYKPELGVSFKGFAFLRIRGAIIDNIRATSELTGRPYKIAKAIQAAEELRSSELFKIEKSAEITEFAAKAALIFKLSLNDLKTEIEPVTMPDAIERLEQQENKQKLLQLIERLSEKERLIITEYYILDYSFTEISKRHRRMSKSWVSRLHDRALANLKRMYLEDYNS